jgi:hypothetical protein
MGQRFSAIALFNDKSQSVHVTDPVSFSVFLLQPGLR